MKTSTPPSGLANLGPVDQLKAGRLPERLLRLLAGREEADGGRSRTTVESVRTEQSSRDTLKKALHR